MNKNVRLPKYVELHPVPTADPRCNKRDFRVKLMLRRIEENREFLRQRRFPVSPVWDDLHRVRNLKNSLVRVQSAVSTKADGGALDDDSMGICGQWVWKNYKWYGYDEWHNLKEMVYELMRALCYGMGTYPAEYEVLLQQKYQISLLEATESQVREVADEAQTLYTKQDNKWRLERSPCEPKECALAAKQRRVFLRDLRALLLARMEQLRS